MIQTIPDSIRRAIRSPFCRSLGPDRGAEAELGVVGELDRLLLVRRPAMIGTTGPKISSRMIRIYWRDAGQDRRGDVGAGRAGNLLGAAAETLGSVGDRVFDELGDELALLGVNHRPDLDVPALRIAEPQRARRSATTPLDELVGDLLDDVDALDPRAGLAGVREAAPDDRRRRRWSRSASAQTIAASLPPSSSTLPFICAAHFCPTSRPTSTEPVKKILPTRATRPAPSRRRRRRG